MGLSDSEKERYRRQLSVEGWHQEALSSAKVLIVGLGGLGSICTSYLAAAGVGHLRLCDSDKVELSNLNRQILYSSNNIDQPKAVLARKRLSALNPDITIESLSERVTQKNAAIIAQDCDLIIDCLDNQESRAILNIISVELKIPLIYAAIDDWQGQLGFFRPPMTPCLACIIPEFVDRGRVVPVFGALPGMIGCLQATAALQYLMSGQAPLSGKLLLVNANTFTFETISFDRNPNCPVCGG
jgi:adenylyltransferase/sulfurtransferase